MSEVVSDTLLSQILMLVQDIHKTTDEFKGRLVTLEVKVDEIIRDGFPNSDLKDHRGWHENRKYSGLRRFLLRVLS